MKKAEPWWPPPPPVPPAPLRPSVAHDYGVSLFWSLVDQIGGTVGTMTLREEMIKLIRAGSYAEAYLMALQHDYQRMHTESFPLPPPGKTRDEMRMAAERAAEQAAEKAAEKAAPVDSSDAPRIDAPRPDAPQEFLWRESED